MAKKKITELTSITAAQLADGDKLLVVDVSDTTMSAQGTNKTLAKSELAEAAGVTAHLADTSDAHDASAISFSATGNIAATDVQAAIAELDSEKAAVAEPIAAAHISDTSDAHDASAISFSATGNLSSTDVQAAVAEVATDAAGALSSHASTTSSVHGISAYGATLVDDADAATARSTLGLGSIATQASSSVTITGGSVTGITDLAVADGGTGASTASAARTNLGADYASVAASTELAATFQTCFPPRDNEYTSPATLVSATTQPGNGVASFSAYWLPKGFVITKLHARVTTGGSTGALCRMFVYKDNGKGEPGALLVDGGTIDATSTTATNVTVSATVPTSGWYHFGAVTQGAPVTTPIYRGCKPVTQPTRHPTLAFVLDGSLYTVAYKTGITGAAPDPLGATAADAGAYAIAVAFAGTNP